MNGTASGTADNIPQKQYSQAGTSPEPAITC